MKTLRRAILVALLAVPVGASAEDARHDDDEGPAARDPDRREADDEDEGNDAFDWLWLSGGVGYQRLDLRTLNVSDGDGDVQDFSAEVLPTRANGTSFDLGVGLRLLFFSVAARARVALLRDSSVDDPFQLWTLGPEIGFHSVFKPVGFYLTLGGGYATIGGLGDAVRGLRRGIDVDGAYLRAQLGFDVYATDVVSLGIQGSIDTLFLAREGVPIRDLLEPEEVATIGEAQARLLEGDQTSAGVSYGVGATLGFHFF